MHPDYYRPHIEDAPLSDSNETMFAEVAARAAEDRRPHWTSTTVKLHKAIEEFAFAYGLTFKEAVDCIAETTEKVYA